MPLPCCKLSPTELLMGRHLKMQSTSDPREQLVPYLGEFHEPNRKFKEKQNEISTNVMRHGSSTQWLQSLDLLRRGTRWGHNSFLSLPGRISSILWVEFCDEIIITLTLCLTSLPRHQMWWNLSLCHLKKYSLDLKLSTANGPPLLHMVTQLTWVLLKSQDWIRQCVGNTSAVWWLC